MASASDGAADGTGDGAAASATPGAADSRAPAAGVAPAIGGGAPVAARTVATQLSDATAVAVGAPAPGAAPATAGDAKASPGGGGANIATQARPGRDEVGPLRSWTTTHQPGPDSEHKAFRTDDARGDKVGAAPYPCWCAMYLVVGCLLPILVWTAYDMGRMLEVADSPRSAVEPTIDVPTLNNSHAKLAVQRTFVALSATLWALSLAQCLMPRATPRERAGRKALWRVALCAGVLAVAVYAVAASIDERPVASTSPPPPPSTAPCEVWDLTAWGGVCDAHYAGVVSQDTNLTLDEADAFLGGMKTATTAILKFAPGITDEQFSLCVNDALVPAICAFTLNRCDAGCAVLPVCRSTCTFIEEACPSLSTALFLLQSDEGFTRAAMAGFPRPADIVLQKLIHFGDCTADDWGAEPFCSGATDDVFNPANKELERQLLSSANADVGVGGVADRAYAARCSPDVHETRLAEYAAVVRAAMEPDDTAWVMRRHAYRVALVFVVWAVPLIGGVVVNWRAAAESARAASGAAGMPEVKTNAKGATLVAAQTRRGLSGTGGGGVNGSGDGATIAGDDDALITRSVSFWWATPSRRVVPASSLTPAAESEQAASSLTRVESESVAADTPTVDKVPTATSAAASAKGKTPSTVMPKLAPPSFLHIIGARQWAIALILVGNGVIMLQVGLAIEANAHVEGEVTTGPTLSALFNLVGLGAMATAAELVMTWRALYKRGVHRYRFGVVRFRAIRPSEEATWRGRAVYRVAAAKEWWEAHMGLHGTYFRARLLAFEVLEVVTQLLGVLDRSDRVPNHVFLVTLVSITFNVIGGAAIAYTHIPHKDQVSLLFELFCDMFYLTYNFVETFDVDDMGLLQTAGLVVPVVLSVDTLRSLSRHVVFALARRDCMAAGIPPSFTTAMGGSRAVDAHTFRSRGSNGGGSGGQLSGSGGSGGGGRKARGLLAEEIARSRGPGLAASNASVDGDAGMGANEDAGSASVTSLQGPRRGPRLTAAQRCARRMPVVRRVIVVVGIALAVIVTTSAVARLVIMEHTCEERLGSDLWQGVPRHDKKFFRNGFFGALDCRFDEVRALELRGTGITAIGDTAGLLTGLRRLDARDNPDLVHVSASVGHASQLSQLLLTGSPVAQALNWRGASPPLTSLPPGLWSQTELQWLDVSDNALVSLQDGPHGEGIGGLTALLHLNASHNALTSLPTELSMLPQLAALLLASNAIGPALPEEVRPAIRRVSRLDLRDNALEALPPEVATSEFDADGGLRLEGNPVVSLVWEGENVGAIPAALWQLPLQVAHLRLNHILSMEPEIASSPAAATLEVLVLDWNDLVPGELRLGPHLHQMPRLHTLLLGNNRLAEFVTNTFPSDLTLPPATRVLSFSCTGATSMPDVIWRAPELRVLTLSMNHIEGLPAVPADVSAADAIPRLEVVDISQTQITTIPDVLLQVPVADSLQLLALGQLSLTNADAQRASIEAATSMVCNAALDLCVSPALAPDLSDEAAVVAAVEARLPYYYNNYPCIGL